MLIFKTIRYRNFLSTGSVFNEIKLNQYDSTLITGKNGEGKSTVLCALTFGLFGRPFRNISKNQLINSINRRQCVVEIEFDVNGHEYMIRRGIKPNVFEIYCDEELISQDAANKDYQKVLEQQILKLNYKTFTQVVILGSATFVPFMQLPSTQRREVIEDILDIKVFSVMNSILKDRASTTRDMIAQVESDVKNQRARIEGQKKLIAVLESSRTNLIEGIQQKIDFNNEAIADAQSKIDQLNRGIEGLSPSQEKQLQLADAVTKLNSTKVKLSTLIAACGDQIAFFEDHETCPSCAQDIAHTHRQDLIADHTSKLSDHMAKLQQTEEMLAKMASRLVTVNADVELIRDKTIEVASHRNTITLLAEQNLGYIREMEAVTVDTSDLTTEKNKMRTLAEEAIALVEQKSDLLDQRHLHEVASALLKDTGIKTAIIREYLPVMNKLINRYLDVMNLYVSFELDESFNEVIKSRNRDTFTYASFSEGEKRRIDLAILFTWRQIAKMKNSVNTNLLFLDEILDSSLDASGMDYFLSIMNDFGEHTNVFVISHRSDQVAERFTNTLLVQKKGDFSTVDQIG